jgi:hypothetical protein
MRRQRVQLCRREERRRLPDVLGTARGYEGRGATAGRAGVPPSGHVGGPEAGGTMITVLLVVLVVVALGAFALNRDNTRLRP